MEAWVFWLVLGVILMVAEILTPTFFIFWFGVGALAASLVSLYLGVYIQIIVFAVVSIVLVLLPGDWFRAGNLPGRSTLKRSLVRWRSLSKR